MTRWRITDPDLKTSIIMQTLQSSNILNSNGVYSKSIKVTLSISETDYHLGCSILQKLWAIRKESQWFLLSGP
jgi:hypothetical protein